MTFLLRLLSLFILVLLLVPFTENGSRIALLVVDRFLPMEIEYGGGKFSRQLQIRRLGYQADGLEIKLSDVVAELSPQCLWRSVICFQQLQAAELEITLLQGSEEEQVEPTALKDLVDTDLVEFPVAVELKSLVVASTRVHWNDGEWRQGPAQLSLRISGSTVEILRASITKPHLELREPAETDVVESNTIALPRIDLPLKLRVNTLYLEHPSWTISGEEHQHASIDLQGDWRNTHLQIRQLQIDSGEWGGLSLQGKIDFVGNWPVEASLDVDLAQPPGWSELHGRSAAVSAQGDLGALVIQMNAPDSFGFELEAEVNVIDTQLPFTATVSASSTEKLWLTEFDGVPGALAGVSIELPLVLSAAGSLVEQSFELQAAASGMGYQSLQLLLEGSHSLGQVTIKDMLLHDSAGENALRGSGVVSLGEQLGWSILLQTDGLQLPQVSEYLFGRLEGSLNLQGSLNDEAWDLQVVDVALQGNVNNLPAHIVGFAGLNSDLLLSHSKLEVELNGAQLSLQSYADKMSGGQLELIVDQLGRWQPDANGRFQLQAEFPDDVGHITFSGMLQDLQWGDVAIKRGTLSGDYSVHDDRAFNLDTGFEELAAGHMEIDILEVKATGNASQQSLSLVSQGDLQGELLVTGALQGDNWQGRLEPTQLQTPRGIWQLQEAVAMSWNGPARQLLLDGHCWTQQSMHICPGDLWLGRRGRGSLDMSGDMAFLAALLPQNITLAGDMQLELEGSWDPDLGVLARGSSQTSSIVFTQSYGEDDSASIGWDRGDALFGYDRDGLSLDWQLQRAGRKPLELVLRLPPERGKGLAGTVSFERMQLSTLAPFFSSFSRLEGALSGELQLSGTVDAPLAHGLLSVKEARVAVTGNPTELEDLDVTLDFQGDWAKIYGNGLFGEGKLRLGGQLVSEPEYRLQLSVEGGMHSVLYPPSTELRVSEKLQIAAAKGHLDIAGEIQVHDGMLEFEQLPEGSVAVSADVVEIDYTGKVIREELPFDISMDVRLGIHDNLKITGSLLETTLGGTLHLLQEPGGTLQLFGSLHTIGGEMRAYQQRLQIKRGTVIFSGEPANPLLDVRAQREISRNNISVGLQVQGRLEQELILEVYSEPAMSSREALSYLLRGRGMDDGAGADGTALAFSMAGGVLNRSAIVTELNRIPGVSNVEFGAEGSEDEAVGTVSGYIGERIYLSYGVGLYEPINVLTARYYLHPRLWLEVVSGLENSIDLYYSFDFE